MTKFEELSLKLNNIDLFACRVNEDEQKKAIAILKEKMAMGLTFAQITGVEDEYYGKKIADGLIGMDYYLYYVITGKVPSHHVCPNKVHCVSCGKYTTNENGLCSDCNARIAATLNDIRQANEVNKRIYGTTEEEK